MPRPPLSRTGWMSSIASRFNLVEGARSCEECSASRIAHCTHQQPAPAQQFWAEQMCAPSLSSTQHGSKFHSSFLFFLLFISDI